MWPIEIERREKKQGGERKREVDGGAFSGLTGSEKAS